VTAFRGVAVNQVKKLTSQPNDRLRFIAPDQRRLLEKNHRRLLMTESRRLEQCPIAAVGNFKQCIQRLRYGKTKTRTDQNQDTPTELACVDRALDSPQSLSATSVYWSSTQHHHGRNHDRARSTHLSCYPALGLVNSIRAAWERFCVGTKMCAELGQDLPDQLFRRCVFLCYAAHPR